MCICTQIYSCVCVYTSIHCVHIQSCTKGYHFYYCKVEWNKTPDVPATSSRRDHRKSKFGLCYATKLIELYCMTKSEFWFSIAWLRTSGGNVRSWSDPVVVPSNPRGRAARAWCMNFFPEKNTKSRAHPPRGPDAPVSSRSSLHYSTLLTTTFVRAH
jgi:hypothetical protein